MYFIDFFGRYIKPIRMRGTGCVHPAPTGPVNGSVYAIRQLDVNFWLYTSGETSIAIDCGYRDEAFPQVLRMDGVTALFLTHADMDHAGGLMSARPPFPHAEVYLHQQEEGMLLGQRKRFRLGPVPFHNPVKYQGAYHLLRDGETINHQGIRVEIIHAPGHTPGHSCYLVDDQVLFTGDCLSLREGKGYAFFDFFNMNTAQNLHSLCQLKSRFRRHPPSLTCTGHSGYATGSGVFSHVDIIAKGSKHAPFDPTAPYDAFK